ncbi:MAG: hypothetical protein NVS4B6_24620 [Mycobacterium sp.]
MTSPPDVQNNNNSRALIDLGSVGILPLSNGIAAPGMPLQLSTADGPTGLPAGGQNLGYLVTDNNAPATSSVADNPSLLSARFQQPGNVT